MNFFINWLKKSPTKKEQPKHFETSVETLLTTMKCGCGKTCGCASAEKPKPVVKKPTTPKAKPTKLEQVKADAERMKKPAPKKPKAK